MGKAQFNIGKVMKSPVHMRASTAAGIYALRLLRPLLRGARPKGSPRSGRCLETQVKQLSLNCSSKNRTDNVQTSKVKPSKLWGSHQGRAPVNTQCPQKPAEGIVLFTEINLLSLNKMLSLQKMLCKRICREGYENILSFICERRRCQKLHHI